jgi:uncharacterized repeat protein (TIGR03843 family)
MADDASSAPQPISIDELLTLLSDGTIEQQGLLPWGSNYTFLVTITRGDRQTAAIYKPRDGERPLWDFPEGTLCQREVAAFVVSHALDWYVVPPTVLRDGPQGVGMVQFYIDSDPNEHYFTLREDDRFRSQFRRIALFDLLINNADRKSGHCLRDSTDHIWGIDHGVAFSVEPKLRTVIWEFAGEELPIELKADLRRFRARLEQPGDPATQMLAGLLDRREINALKRRADQLLQAGCYPRPLPGYRQIPWPPV